jgi:hypothetical protein
VLRREVGDIVTRTIAEHPRKNLRERIDEWWKKSTMGGIVALVLFLSTIGATGLTWFGRIQGWRGDGSSAATSSPGVPAQQVTPIPSAIASQGAHADAGIQDASVIKTQDP